MGKKLKKGEETKIVPLVENPVVAMIERMIMNPEVDADKMQQIIDMKHMEEDREASREYTRAMVRVQSGLSGVTRDKFNMHTKSHYPSLEAMKKAVIPAYTAEGFAMSYGEGDTTKEEHIRVTCEVMHIAGHSKSFFYDCPMDDKGMEGKPNKTKTHGKASAVSYGERYLLKLIFNVTIQDEDDDGNAAGQVAELITEDQALELHAMLSDNELSVERFERWLKADWKCDGIDGIYAENFKSAKEQIQESIDNKT